MRLGRGLGPAFRLIVVWTRIPAAAVATLPDHTPATLPLPVWIAVARRSKVVPDLPRTLPDPSERCRIPPHRPRGTDRACRPHGDPAGAHELPEAGVSLGGILRPRLEHRHAPAGQCLPIGISCRAQDSPRAAKRLVVHACRIRSQPPHPPIRCRTEPCSDMSDGQFASAADPAGAAAVSGVALAPWEQRGWPALGRLPYAKLLLRQRGVGWAQTI